MKRLTLLLITVLSLGLSACSKRNCCVPPIAESYISALKNGQQWALAARMFSTQDDSVAIGGYSINESLTFKIKLNGKGDYVPTNARYYTLVGGDVATSQYNLKADPANVIHITSYNSSTQVAEGSFELKLVKDSHYSSVTLNDVVFTKGEFKVRLTQ